MHPTKANYQKAFGTKNDIGYRVDKYNQSQQQGAGYVKTAVKVGVGIAAVATAIPSGGTSLVAAAGAMAAAGGVTAAVDIAVDVSDRTKNHGSIQRF